MPNIPCNCPKGGSSSTQKLPLAMEVKDKQGDPWLVYSFACAAHGSWNIRSRSLLALTPELIERINREHGRGIREHTSV